MIVRPSVSPASRVPKPVVRLAVVGAGRMGARHAAASVDLPNGAVTWVVDVDLSRAERLAAEHGAQATAHLDQALASGEVDATVVATPTPSHREVVERVAAAGNHVLCEKPIARTAEDGWAIVEACARAGVRLMVGHVLRFSSAYRLIRALLEQDALGTVRFARAVRTNSDPRIRRDWYADFDASGGPILDLMIHDIDALRWYFGEVTSVAATGIGGSSFSTIDGATAHLIFGGGLTARLETSWKHHELTAATTIVGSNGTLELEGGKVTVRPSSGREQPVGTCLDGRPNGPVRSPYQAQLQHFLTRIVDGGQFLASGEDAVRTLDVALAAVESVRTGRAVHPGPSDARSGGQRADGVTNGGDR